KCPNPRSHSRYPLGAATFSRGKIAKRGQTGGKLTRGRINKFSGRIGNPETERLCRASHHACYRYRIEMQVIEKTSIVSDTVGWKTCLVCDRAAYYRQYILLESKLDTNISTG